jgi:hypothetical protein
MKWAEETAQTLKNRSVFATRLQTPVCYRIDQKQTADRKRMGQTSRLIHSQAIDKANQFKFVSGSRTGFRWLFPFETVFALRLQRVFPFYPAGRFYPLQLTDRSRKPAMVITGMQ